MYVPISKSPKVNPKTIHISPKPLEGVAYGYRETESKLTIAKEKVARDIINYILDTNTELEDDPKIVRQHNTLIFKNILFLTKICKLKNSIAEAVLAVADQEVKRKPQQRAMRTVADEIAAIIYREKENPNNHLVTRYLILISQLVDIVEKQKRTHNRKIDPMTINPKILYQTRKVVYSDKPYAPKTYHYFISESNHIPTEQMELIMIETLNADNEVCEQTHYKGGKITHVTPIQTQHNTPKTNNVEDT
jgi:hypothetical protein